MLKIRRPLGRLIFNMGIAIPGKTVFLIETAPCICPGPSLKSFRQRSRCHGNFLYRYDKVFTLDESLKVSYSVMMMWILLHFRHLYRCAHTHMHAHTRPHGWLSTHCGQVTQYSDQELGQYWASNGLVPDGTKLSPEPILTNHHWGQWQSLEGNFARDTLAPNR